MPNSQGFTVSASDISGDTVSSKPRFQLNYSALVRAMTSPFVAKVQSGRQPVPTSYVNR